MDEERRSRALTDENKAIVINSFCLLLHLGNKLNGLLPCPLTSQSIGHRYEVRPLSRATIDQKHVIQKIGSNQVKKSAGPDNVNLKLLKLAGNVIVPSLTRVYQHNLDDETVSSQRKLARVTPIHKGDNETDSASYRPINKHLMTGPEGNSEFRFPRRSRGKHWDSRETKFTVSHGTNHKLVPWETIINCYNSKTKEEQSLNNALRFLRQHQAKFNCTYWSRATAVNISRVAMNCFPFDVIVFAILLAHGIWRETVSLLDVMWPWTSQ